MNDLQISRVDVARRVYRATRARGWGRVRAARWAVGAWRRWPDGMLVKARPL